MSSDYCSSEKSTDCKSSSSECKCKMNDKLATKIQNYWKKYFPDALILPIIGFPSNSGGVMTLTHTMGGPQMSIDGLISKSPLANNALYSVECSDNKYLNLYEIMIPDIPGFKGEPSTAEVYVKALGDCGLDVAGVHFHWWGSSIYPNDKGVTAVHHQKIHMHPMEFTRLTIKALHKVMKVIKRRTRILNNTNNNSKKN